MTSESMFRPAAEPARSIFDRWYAESRLREDRSVEEWVQRERMVVEAAAKDAAARMGVLAPSREAIERAEVSAMGHVDYGAKWAIRVADLLLRADRPIGDS